jgi:hypothetical protein
VRVSTVQDVAACTSHGRVRRLAAAATTASALLAGVVGCSSAGAHGGTNTSVFRVKVGECFLPPAKVQAELTKLDKVSCTAAHTQEAYAVVDYKAAGGATATADYPGDTALKAFADGTCAQRFAGYVGRAYQDSSLFFTYLLPSARGWQQGHDRKVVCFVTTTGGLLHKSVKGSKT